MRTHTESCEIQIHHPFFALIFGFMGTRKGFAHIHKVMRPTVLFRFIAGCCMSDTADVAAWPVVPAEKNLKRLPMRVQAMEAPLNDLVVHFPLRPLNAALPDEEAFREIAVFDIRVGGVIKNPPKVVATAQADNPKDARSIIVLDPELKAPAPKISESSVKPVERPPVVLSSVTAPSASVQTETNMLVEASPAIPSEPAKLANPSITQKESPSVKRPENTLSPVISDPVLSVLKMLQEDLLAEDGAKVDNVLVADRENLDNHPKPRSEKQEKSNGFLLKTYQFEAVNVGEPGKLREIQQLLNGLLPEGSSVTSESNSNCIDVFTTNKAHGGVVVLFSKIDIQESIRSPALVPNVDDQIVAKANAVLQSVAENAMRLEKIEEMIRSIDSAKVPESVPVKPSMAPIWDWKYRYKAAGAAMFFIVASILWWRNRKNKRRREEMAAEQLKEEALKRIAEMVAALASAKLERGQKVFIDQVNARITAMETDVREQRIDTTKPAQEPKNSGYRIIQGSSSAGIAIIPFGHDHASIGLQLELPLKQ